MHDIPVIHLLSYDLKGRVYFLLHRYFGIQAPNARVLLIKQIKLFAVLNDYIEVEMIEF